MKHGIFVVGTDTDVGKTYVSGVIARYMVDQGVSTGYFKAAVSGNVRKDGRLIPGDAQFVRQMAGLTQPLSEMVPYVYEQAYSPHLASRLEGGPVEMNVVQDFYERCASNYDFVVAEGSGGILCPLRQDETHTIWLEDVIRMTGLSCVLVADAGLGTINHVLLTTAYMRAKDLPLEGIILNHWQPDLILHRDNEMMIKQETGLPILGHIRSA